MVLTTPKSRGYYARSSLLYRSLCQIFGLWLIACTQLSLLSAALPPSGASLAAVTDVFGAANVTVIACVTQLKKDQSNAALTDAELNDICTCAAENPAAGQAACLAKIFKPKCLNDPLSYGFTGEASDSDFVESYCDCLLKDVENIDTTTAIKCQSAAVKDGGGAISTAVPTTSPREDPNTTDSPSSAADSTSGGGTSVAETSTSSGDSEGLSSGATIGIVFGCILGGVVAVLLIFFCCYKKEGKSNNKALEFRGSTFKPVILGQEGQNPQQSKDEENIRQSADKEFQYMELQDDIQTTGLELSSPTKEYAQGQYQLPYIHQRPQSDGGSSMPNTPTQEPILVTAQLIEAIASCPRCHSEVFGNAAFCGACGLRLATSAEVPDYSAADTLHASRGEQSAVDIPANRNYVLPPGRTKESTSRGASSSTPYKR